MARLSPIILTLLLLPMLSAPSPAPAITLKVATIAPQHSIWAKRFDQFKEFVDQQSEGTLTLRIYYGGVMGDDQAMYRKMRVGQLHGAGLTVTGLGAIVPDFRVLSIPFLFSSYQQVDRAWQRLTPIFRDQFADKKLFLLAPTEVGFVSALSTTPITGPSDLAASRCWIPNGDPLSRAFLENLGAAPIPLAIPDVLTALQTGMLKTAFTSPYGSLVLQWFTAAGYLSDIPFGYAYGALVFDQRAMAKLTAGQRRILVKGAARYFTDKLIADTRKSNQEAIDTLRAGGITVTTTRPEAISRYHRIRDQTINQLRGKIFSTAIYDQLRQALAAQ